MQRPAFISPLTNHTLSKSLSNWICQHPDRTAVIILLVSALFTRFLMIHHPVSAVFDEVHFNYFAGFYYTGQYYYDIHPPLGKLLIALSAWPFGGIAPEDVVRTISTPYPSSSYLAMRALPAIFGSALPVLLFLIARQLNIGVKSAFVAGAIAIFDNALLIQSRLILLDAMLLGFGFLSLYLFLVARASNNIKLWCLSAVFAGCSFSIKWIGVSFLGLIGLTIIIDWIRQLWKQGWIIQPFYKGSAFLAISIVTYMAVFYAHFALLPISHHQGDQFMTPAFRSTLKGSEYEGATSTVYNFHCPSVYVHTLRYGMPNTEVKPAEATVCKIEYNEPFTAPNFFQKLVELNRTMYTTNQGLKQSHPDSSPWYMWPLMHKPLYYWYNDGARIYSIGNPAVWWLCTLAVLGLFLAQLWFSSLRHTEAFWILAIGACANLLPFMIVTRVMFMYHYLTSLCFSMLLTAYLLDKIPFQRYVRRSYLLILLAGFLMMSPLTYGVNWYGSDMLWFLRFFGWHP